MTLQTDFSRVLPLKGTRSSFYSDKIIFSTFEPDMKPRYRYFDSFQKVDGDGVLHSWTFEDARRRAKGFENSLARTRRSVIELSEKNRFDYHLTISFNRLYVNRYSAVCVHKTFKNVMKRLKYCFKGIKAVCVSEFHKDGAIHYHLMISFAVRPKLRYRQEDSLRLGHSCYSILNNFKKNDCFLFLEKLEKNNVHYLVKYINKGYEFPLARRFSATRGLNRSRLLEKKYIGAVRYDDLYRFAKSQSMTLRTRVDGQAVFELSAVQRDGAAVADLFKCTTKDETWEQRYLRLLDDWDIFLQYGLIISTKAPEFFDDDKLSCALDSVQLSFDL